MRTFFISVVFTLLCIFSLSAQEKPLKREVTLYNPYKPSLNQSGKINYMPDMTDTARFRPAFNYNVSATPFMPSYTVSPIKAAVLQPDPLDKLYKSYVKIGLGNYFSPLATLSITNERSKKGAIGFYGNHYSNNGNIKLANGRKIFAGYMDNDLSLFGRRFFKSSVIGGSIDYLQKTRHAYGYDPEILNFVPGKKDTRLGYGDIGATLSLSSTRADSSRFAYQFSLGYDYFYDNQDFSRNRLKFNGEMAKLYKGFFAGSGLEFVHFNSVDNPRGNISSSDYIFALKPFVKKSTSQWQFRVGLQAVLEKYIEEDAKVHLYPDLGFGFSIVPSYLGFFSSLTGYLEQNDQTKTIEENPFILPKGDLYLIPNTDHKLVVKAGFRGNTGLDGTYELSASYSLIDNMIFFSNLLSNDTIYGRGNYFLPYSDDVDVLNIHGGMNGRFSNKLTFDGRLNFYKYNLTSTDFPINRPEWDVSLDLKYNLRDKIIASLGVTALGSRTNMVTRFQGDLPGAISTVSYLDEPWHLNLNLGAEYRYSKILSFWMKFNNLSSQRYNEWAFYPTHRYLFMLGFTYSL